MVDTVPSFEVSPGLDHPLGVSQTESGINFAIFSQHASAVTLCIILPKRLDWNVRFWMICFVVFNNGLTCKL